MKPLSFPTVSSFLGRYQLPFSHKFIMFDKWLYGQWQGETGEGAGGLRCVLNASKMHSDDDLIEWQPADGGPIRMGILLMSWQI